MKKYKISFILISIICLASCKEDFLDRPSVNNPTLDTYYVNAQEVNAATGYLYNSVWYDYSDKAFHSIGEALSGNMLTETGVNYDGGSFNNFTVLSTDGMVSSTWRSLYKVAGTSTVLLKTFEQKKASVADGAYLDLGIAESRFMRGVAYFYLARIFKDVPIVEDPVALAGSGDYNIPRYLQADVLRFVLEDLQYAKDNLPAAPYAPGRASSYSAAGMMAKVYLYMKDYANAKKEASEVMASGKYDLYPDYEKMFTSSAANNNVESLFALQWIAGGGYGYANAVNAYAAPSTLLKPGFGTGYSSVYPTIDVLNSYAPQDKRRQWSNMEQGFTRKDWTNSNFPDGFKYDTTGTQYETVTTLRNGSRANSLKYVVGPGSNGEPLSPNGSSSICTYMLRYADVLLIYAESVLAEGASTSDASALAAFNKVHNRNHNFNDVPVTALTPDVILKERRAEFAYEGDYWFDIQRQGFTKAKAIIEKQDRGSYSGTGVNHLYAHLTSESQLFLPIPQAETVSDPQLLQEAVPYYK
ncbi:RagB/SusD family nutrient uptake outer membrane protein [Arcticibacter eurypsychrophilus]|uniref:RagB/SusD family nutrient uptake outer membrane protein n=1 Tax=Arcticibacter eurypsychrophilus TaxID=1434752 RepID=UPI00084D9507|nr:RagB/SusD family nutrient uptake outer membrane protein [Arcticibacter eurypsychrophilus]